jgi:tRNA(Arg) A34 adenosine deaminase TadA
MNYELFMAEAIAEAKRGAAEGEEPIGSVAVVDDATTIGRASMMTQRRTPCC